MRCRSTFTTPSLSPSGPRPQLKLLCGADFLDTFKIPGLWLDDHVEEVVGRFGLVCVSRGGLQPELAVHESDTLSCHSKNIFLVREWVRNETSATEVRRALRRGQSVKYLIPDSVLDYIHQHNLYTEESERKNEGTILRPLVKQAQQPVKSLDDWEMDDWFIEGPEKWGVTHREALSAPTDDLQTSKKKLKVQICFHQFQCEVVYFNSYTSKIADPEPHCCASI